MKKFYIEFTNYLLFRTLSAKDSSTKRFFILFFDKRLRSYLLSRTHSFFAEALILKCFRFKFIKLLLKKGDLILLKKYMRYVSLDNIKYFDIFINSKSIISKMLTLILFNSFKSKLYENVLYSQLFGSLCKTYSDREMVKNAVMSNFSLSKKNLIDKCRIALEWYDLEYVLNTLGKKYFLYPVHRNTFLELLSYAQVLSGNFEGAKATRNRIISRTHCIQSKNFENKNVLVLGPSSKNVMNFFDDTNFDIVIYINNMITNIGDSKAQNIAYFNSEYTGENYQTICNYQNILDLMIFKSIDDINFVKNYINKENLFKIKLINSSDNIFFNFWLPMPMALQNILYDLSWSYPSSIHVSGFNLYAHSSMSNYYSEYTNLSNEQIIQNLRVHDPISNFQLAKNSRQSNLFIPDSTLESILDLSVDDYCRCLDQLYFFKN